MSGTSNTNQAYDWFTNIVYKKAKISEFIANDILPPINSTQSITRITKGISKMNLTELLAIFNNFKRNDWIPKTSQNYTRDAADIEHDELLEIVRHLLNNYVGAVNNRYNFFQAKKSQNNSEKIKNSKNNMEKIQNKNKSQTQNNVNNQNNNSNQNENNDIIILNNNNTNNDDDYDNESNISSTPELIQKKKDGDYTPPSNLKAPKKSRRSKRLSNKNKNKKQTKNTNTNPKSKSKKQKKSKKQLKKQNKSELDGSNNDNDDDDNDIDMTSHTKSSTTNPIDHKSIQGLICHISFLQSQTFTICLCF